MPATLPTTFQSLGANLAARSANHHEPGTPDHEYRMRGAAAFDAAATRRKRRNHDDIKKLANNAAGQIGSLVMLYGEADTDNGLEIQTGLQTICDDQGVLYRNGLHLYAAACREQIASGATVNKSAMVRHAAAALTA